MSVKEWTEDCKRLRNLQSIEESWIIAHHEGKELDIPYLKNLRSRILELQEKTRISLDKPSNMAER
jgi:hypothetical protein